jgi:hypothetical protein
MYRKIRQKLKQIGMAKNNSWITNLFRAIAGILFLGWLFIFCRDSVIMAPDSYGYMADAKGLSDPTYQTIRPILFPAFLRLIGYGVLKMSVVTFLINIASLLYLLHIAEGRGRWFYRRTAVILICFLLLPGIWSYCGIYLTESILFAVEIWIFIFLTRVILPEKPVSLLMTIVYSLLIGVLAITLKPWIMIFVVVSGLLLFLSSLVFRAFRPCMRSSLILLVVSVLSFAWSFQYSSDKSPGPTNMVLLMISSGKVEDLKQRLKEDKGLNSEEAAYIRSMVADLDLINNKYKSSPWDAAQGTELKILHINDSNYIGPINKAFKIAFCERLQDILGLTGLAFSRYVSDLSVGSSCLDIAYGPTLPGLKKFAVLVILIALGLLVLYRIISHLRKGNKAASLPSLLYGLKKNEQLLIFTVVTLLSSIFFCLFLCLAGGVELQRTVLPPVLFQLFILSFYMLRPGQLPKP